MLSHLCKQASLKSLRALHQPVRAGVQARYLATVVESNTPRQMPVSKPRATPVSHDRATFTIRVRLVVRGMSTPMSAGVVVQILANSCLGKAGYCAMISCTYWCCRRNADLDRTDRFSMAHPLAPSQTSLERRSSPHLLLATPNP